MINALELTWKIPYDIPNDRTEAKISCTVDDKTADYLTIFQSSFITSGWGIGNCWYDGEPTGTPYAHAFTCENIGEIKKNTEHSVAF